MGRNPNRLLLGLVLILTFLVTTGNWQPILAVGANKTTREVVDLMGRKVTIPIKVNKVVSLSNNTTVMIYTLAPEKLLGWSFNPNPDAKKYIPEKYFNLPVLGTSSGKTSNYENILKLHPDLIICSDEDEIFSPDDIQRQLHIPVVKVPTALNATDKVYLFLGDCLGETKRAKQLAAYSRKVLDRMRTIVNKIPVEKQVRVYYAEGPTGLQTDITGNVHTEVLDFVKGKNVANINEAKVGSMVAVSIEQLLAWNPEVILVGFSRQGDFYDDVFKDPNWANLKAVKEKNVYKIPRLPFNWFDRPPSVARVLAIQWLGNLLYPQYVKVDLAKEIKSFFANFYNYKLTDGEVRELLKNAVAKP